MSKIFLATFGFLIASASSVVSFAQISMPMPDGMMVGDSLSILWDDADAQRSGSAKKPAASPVAPAQFSFDFKPSAARRKANIANFIEQNRRSNPAVGAELDRVFANNDVIAALDQALGNYGLKVTNVADAYSVWWISAWEAANAIGNSKMDRTSVKMVKSQVENTLRSAPGLANATDAQKQEIAEQLLLQAAIFDSLGKVAASDPDKARQISDNVKRTVGQAGLNLNAYTLTQNGFVPANKKRSDAAEPSGGKDNAVADASTAPDGEGWSNGKLALIAAAGGAGLAGVFLFGKAIGKKG